MRTRARVQPAGAQLLPEPRAPHAAHPTSQQRGTAPTCVAPVQGLQRVRHLLRQAAAVEARGAAGEVVVARVDTAVE